MIRTVLKFISFSLNWFGFSLIFNIFSKHSAIVSSFYFGSV